MGTSTRYRDDLRQEHPATADPAVDPVKDILPPNAELVAAIHDVQISLDAVLEKIAELVAVMKQHGSG